MLKCFFVMQRKPVSPAILMSFKDIKTALLVLQKNLNFFLLGIIIGVPQRIWADRYAWFRRAQWAGCSGSQRDVKHWIRKHWCWSTWTCNKLPFPSAWYLERQHLTSRDYTISCATGVCITWNGSPVHHAVMDLFLCIEHGGSGSSTSLHHPRWLSSSTFDGF